MTIIGAMSQTRALQHRSNQILAERQFAAWKQTDRLFAGLLAFQCVAGIAAAFWIAPRAWEGTSSHIHPHVWAATVLGVLLVSLPIYLVWAFPGRVLTRHSIAISQVMYSALLIHLSGGRIETHFHIFGSLAFLAFYRDWPVLITATVVIAADHITRGAFWPQSIFGTLTASPWRAFEHAGWVLFEDVFLVWSCYSGVQEMRRITQQEAALEATNDFVESQVRERTAQLCASQLELRRSENAIRAIVETAGDGIITFDALGTIQFANPSVGRLFGYESKELIGKNVQPLMPSHTETGNTETLHSHLCSSISQLVGSSREVLGKRRDGSTFPIDLTVSQVDNEGEERFTGIVRDITARREADQRRSEQARLSAFAADIGQALTRGHDMKVTLGLCATAIVQHLHATIAEIWILDHSGQNLDLMATANIDQHLNRPLRIVPVGQLGLGRAAQEKRAYVATTEVDRVCAGTDGLRSSREVFACTGHPLIVQDRLVGAFEVLSQNALSDETFDMLSSVANSIAVAIERFHSEVRLQHAMDVAEQANIAKSQFLANMSHELRTPMNAIIGYSEMLEEDFEDAEQAQFIPDVRKIHAAGKHLLGLINDILDLSKIEAGRMDVFPEQFCVSDFMDDIVSTTRPLVEQKGNTLNVRMSTDLGVACTDQTKVRQILFNLISNAAKFTDHGKIEISISRTPDHGEDWLQMSVIDSGIGMNRDQQERIFEAFTQAEASTTRRFGGTGLGLTISKRFCEMLGGRLTVESEQGIGSHFSVMIPALYLSPSAIDPVNGTESHPGPPQHECAKRNHEILVIDDDPYARDLLRRFLNKEGYLVITASSGADALELAKQRHPMAITLDVMMPGMDGWSVLRELKDDSAIADIPVIMISMVDQSAMGYALGVAEYLNKPPDRLRLGGILQKYRSGSNTHEILIVDDDENNREMLADLASKSGFASREAKDGSQALAMISERRPDLVLLDLMMPEMDGFQVVAELTRLGLASQIPIIILTSKDLTLDDRALLHGRVKSIRNKVGLSRDALLQEIKGYVNFASVCNAGSNT